MSAVMAFYASEDSAAQFMTNPRSYRTEVRLPLQPIKYQQYTPIEAPAGLTYAAFLRTWNDDHVARWLNDIKCGCYEDIFKVNDIRGDLLLELDQKTLQEMGVSSIGDRLRILNAVKILRQRVSGKPALIRKPSLSSDMDKGEGHGSRTLNRRLENVRPAPLQLNANAGRGDLPAIQRDPDSARLASQQQQQQQQQQQPSQPQQLSQNVRPLPMPMQVTPSNVTPNSAHSGPRTNLPPPPPPPPRTQPPPPPGQGRTNRSYTNSPAPDATAYTLQGSSGLHTPSSGNWVNQHLPADPRPGNPGSRPGSSGGRAISPLPPARLRPNQIGGVQSVHGRNNSIGNPIVGGSPGKRPVGNAHPYASAQPQSNQPTSNLASSLSPIDEAFSTPLSTTPSPPTNTYTVGRGPFNLSSSNGPSSLDDLRKRLVKFVVPDEGLSFTIDVASCNGGVEVVEKVLKKFVKNNPKTDTNIEVSQTEDGGLSVDGWGVYMDIGQGEYPGQLLTEAELLSICHAPDHPTREYGLVLRRLPRITNGPLTNLSNRSTKRASSISILSGLGVRDPERALDASVSPPTSSVSLLGPSGRLSPASHISKRPSKLRNFFGQRPPSELITNHLTEFFPNAEKKVLQRTARNSMMRRRDSVALSSRFSVSTQGSRLSQPPPVPDKEEILPRVSLSTDDGRSVDLQIGSSHDAAKPTIPHIPPIPFPSMPLSESIDDVTNVQKKRMSRVMSTSSNRMSYMTELRSKRDKSDTASLMTVDQITEAVENRRASGVYGREEDLDGWTKVDSEIENMVPKAVADDDDDDAVDEVEDEDESEISSVEEEDETLHEEGDELNLDVDDDGVIRNVISAKRANKWIKGALIGAGSFGKVYLGMDASNGLLMAVKQVELPTSSGPNQDRKKSMLTALEREIELLKNLHHENIVQYLYSSIDDEFLNIFLEYVPGGSVTALLRNYGAFEEPLVKNFVRQILQGLNYLHERDIIHRDIKGANILVDNKGGVKISDFGISKKVDTLLTGNRMNRPSLQGSVFWMAPEVVKQTGHTHKADIWSVGCLVVEMLTSEHPWAQLTQMQAIFKIGSSATPTIPSDITLEAQDFLRQTFKVDHEARPSAAMLLQHTFTATIPTK